MTTPLIFMEDEYIGYKEPVVRRQPWSGVGGKKYLASLITKLIPEHETYVEAFAGGAAVFFMRESVSKREVLNDMDPEIYSAYKFVKYANETHVRQLLKMNWSVSRDRFLKLREVKSESLGPVARFHRFFYMARQSYSGNRRSWGNRGITEEHMKSWVKTKLPRYAERLRNAIVTCADYEKVVSRFDDKKSFIYLDPPYERDLDPSLERGVKFDHERFAKVCKGIKGKMIISYDNTPGNRKRLSGLVQRFVRTPKRQNTGGGVLRTELLVANFPIRPRNKFEELVELIEAAS